MTNIECIYHISDNKNIRGVTVRSSHRVFASVVWFRDVVTGKWEAPTMQLVDDIIYAEEADNIRLSVSYALSILTKMEKKINRRNNKS